MGRTVESKDELTFTYNGFLWCSIYQTQTWSLYRTNSPTSMQVHSRTGTTQSHHAVTAHSPRKCTTGGGTSPAHRTLGYHSYEVSGTQPHMWANPGAGAKRGQKT